MGSNWAPILEIPPPPPPPPLGKNITKTGATANNNSPDPQKK
jgi:hypothetical protein